MCGGQQAGFPVCLVDGEPLHPPHALEGCKPFQRHLQKKKKKRRRRKVEGRREGEEGNEKKEERKGKKKKKEKEVACEGGGRERGRSEELKDATVS